MRRLREILGRAFAVDPPGPAEPTEAERPIVDRLCREVVRRGMTAPALLALECSRPMNFLGSQAMHFFQPMASVLVSQRHWDSFAAFLERRGAIEFLARRIEELEQERAASEGGTPPSGEAVARADPSGGRDQQHQLDAPISRAPPVS